MPEAQKNHLTIFFNTIRRSGCLSSQIARNCWKLTSYNVKVIAILFYISMMTMTISLLHSGPGLSGGAWVRIAYLWYLFALCTAHDGNVHKAQQHICKQHQTHCSGTGSGGAGSLRGVGAAQQYNPGTIQCDPTKRCRDQGRPVSRVTPGVLMLPLLPLGQILLIFANSSDPISRWCLWYWRMCALVTSADWKGCV